MKKLKHLAPVLALLAAFIMLFSVLYIALEADHDCCGEGCSVCAQIRACEDLLWNILTAVLTAVAARCFLVLRRVFAGVGCCAFHPHTLFALKVKLSD